MRTFFSSLLLLAIVFWENSLWKAKQPRYESNADRDWMEWNKHETNEYIKKKCHNLKIINWISPETKALFSSHDFNNKIGIYSAA